jgi:hypothetical protein
MYIHLYIHLYILHFPTGSLSPGGLLLCSLATYNSAIKTVGEGAAHTGTLPWTPDGLRRTPRGQGLSPRRAAGKVVKGPEEGGLGDEEKDDDDDDDDSISSYMDRWVPGSGTFCLVCWGSSGLWRLWFPLKGDHGRLLFLPRPTPDPGIFQFH